MQAVLDHRDTRSQQCPTRQRPKRWADSFNTHSPSTLSVDATAAIGKPEDLLDWTDALVRPLVLAWRCVDSGYRYVQVQARHAGPPVVGHLTIYLACENYREFWSTLVGQELSPGTESDFDRRALRSAYTKTAPYLQRHLTPEPATA